MIVKYCVHPEGHHVVVIRVLILCADADRFVGTAIRVSAVTRAELKMSA